MTVLYRQLVLMGKIARAPDDSDLREAIFQSGSNFLQQPAGNRKIGRPRMRWETVVHAHAVAAAGSLENFNSKVLDQKMWRTLAREYSYSC